MNSLFRSFLYSASLVWPMMTSSMSVCGELLRLDLVLLRAPEQIVEERDVELEHLDELDDAAVGDVELAVEVERARIGVRAVLGDLAVVDVARELGRVLVLLVLGLERADADAVLLAEHEPSHADVLADHLRPVAARTCPSARLKMKRLAGSRSPSTRTLNLSFERPSSSMALARHSGGMRRSGSSFIGLGNRLGRRRRCPCPQADPVEREERAIRRCASTARRPA